MPLLTTMRCASLAAALLAVGCEPQAAPGGAAAQPALDAVLWMQASAEHRAVTLQTYAQAERLMLEGLADPSWSAIEGADGVETKPPAVIVDVDETVLDNTPYQVRLLKAGKAHNKTMWRAWVQSARARAVPGAQAFAKAAAAQGVKVFFVTNRDHAVEEATARNLKALGFVLPDNEDRLLTEDERPGWTKDKISRRAHVASTHRVLLVIGDQLADFVSGSKADGQARATLMATHRARFGRHWLMMPNPMYGHWESRHYDFDWGSAVRERAARKASALQEN